MTTLLAASLGNSRLALGVFELPASNGVPSPSLRVFLPLPDSARYAPDFAPGGAADVAVVASVNPPRERAVLDWLSREFALAPLRFPADLPSPVSCRAEQVGADRLANAAAAHEEFGGGCVIVDAGTAITVDAVSRDGAFLGGAILPGVRLCAAALARGTALLPELDPDRSDAAIGLTTEDAVASGLLRGLAGAVDRLVAEVGAELGETYQVIATGGDADRLAPHCDAGIELRPHLTLSGLVAAYCSAPDTAC